MALKAGYYGIKKKMVNKLTKLTGIYSIGSGLNLSSAGSLSVKNATTSQKGIVQLDDVPTDESNNVPTSNGVYDALQERVSWDEQAVLGAKNFSGPLQSLTNRDVTISTDLDDVSTITGTANANGGRMNLCSLPYHLKKGSYKLVLLGTDNWGDACCVSNKNTDALIKEVRRTDITNNIFTISDDADVVVGLTVTSGVSYNGTLQFMITLATDTDDTYAPYAMTNKELTEKVQGIIDVATNAADFAAFKTAIGNL